MTSLTPVRNPDLGSRPLMTRRAWWLVLLNLFIPGSAQVLAGSRRLGRFGLGATLLLWVLVVVVVAWYLLARESLITVATNYWVLWIAQALLLFYAVLWVVLTLDALRLTRLVRTKPAMRPLIAGFSVLTLLAVAGGAAYGANIAGVTRSTIADVFGGGEVAEPIDGRYNILLLGADAGPDRQGLRPDSISVASIDAETGQTTLIGVPRNLEFIPFPEGSPMLGPFPNGYDCGDECLISYLYTYGIEHPELYPEAEAQGSDAGIEAMRDAVEGVTGLAMQYFTLIDMQGFADLIDALGGVEITVEQRLPIGGGVVPGTNPPELFDVEGWIEPGTQRMDGHTALWYARSRITTTDYDRMRRQREVQEAVLRQFSPANVLTKFQAVAETGANVVRTDIPQGMLGRFVELADLAREQEIARVELTNENGIDVGAPDYALIRQLIAEANAPAPEDDGQ